MGTDSTPLSAVCLLLSDTELRRPVPWSLRPTPEFLLVEARSIQGRHLEVEGDMRITLTCPQPTESCRKPQSLLPHVSCPPVFFSSLVHFQGNTSSFIPWNPRGSLGS